MKRDWILLSWRPSADEIIHRVRVYYGLPESVSIKSRRRAPHVVAPRLVAMYLVRQYTSLSFPQIGRIFERDHSTVLSACRTVRERPELMEAAIDIVSRLTLSTGEAA